MVKKDTHEAVGEQPIKPTGVLEARKEKLARLFAKEKKSLAINLIVLAVLLVILIVTINVRTSNISGLKDITTGNYTLAPDLDPFLFLRWAKYIAEHGRLMYLDSMRYVPLGYYTEHEAALTSYLIAYLYKFLHVFSQNITVDFVAIIYPVIFFCLAAIFFFLFVRRLFVQEEAIKRNAIALISTLFFVFMPSLLHRTTAGVPEKEAGGIFLMFLAFYLFAASLQCKNKKNAFIVGFLGGLATSLLNITWGGSTFVFYAVGLTMLAFFFLRNISKENFFAFFGWISALTIFCGMIPFTAERPNYIMGLLGTTVTQIPYAAFLLIAIDLFLTPKVYEKIKLKIPKIFFSVLVTAFIGLAFVIATNPSMITGFLPNLKTQLLHPIGIDRITLTVAENNQPYLGSWMGTFTSRYFWLFIAGAVLLFYNAVRKFKKIERYCLAAAYALFLICLIYSRHASDKILNGTSALSQIVYFGGFAVFFLTAAFFYYNAYRSKETDKFKEIDKFAVLFLVMFFISVVSARGAIRLFFLLAPMTTILIAFIIVDVSERALKSKNELAGIVFWISLAITCIVLYTFSFSNKAIASVFILAAISRIVAAFVKGEEDLSKILLWILAIAVITTIMFPSFYIFSSSTASEAKYSKPGYYEMQWQRAMEWVRNNTPEDAVFSHWWDYGYWVQSIGERATFLDGGNTIGYWDHLMGRYVLTGQNETEALEVLKSHNISYLLIDSTDIGKYPAYSSIGSDVEYDRYNWIPTFMLDEKQTQETRNEKILVYQGGTNFEHDFVWYDKDTKKQYIFPGQSNEAVIAGVLVPTINLNDTLQNLSVIEQPKAVVIYRGNTRIDIPMCYIYYTNLYDFRGNGPCLNASLYIIPKIEQTDAGISIVYNGVALYLNERALNALWVRLYLLKEGENFKLEHAEPNPILEQISQQGIEIGEFAYFSSIMGPIKIWSVNYSEDIKVNPQYLNTSWPDIRLYMSR